MAGPRVIDLTDQTYGSLKVLRRGEPRYAALGAWWLCQCQCGVEISYPAFSLRSGNAKSCGCARGGWTKERMATLSTLLDQGLSRSQIGERMGYSKSAVCGKAWRLAAEGRI